MDVWIGVDGCSIQDQIELPCWSSSPWYKRVSPDLQVLKTTVPRWLDHDHIRRCKQDHRRRDEQHLRSGLLRRNPEYPLTTCCEQRVAQSMMLYNCSYAWGSAPSIG